MLKKIINFIKYHNAFTIGLILVFVFSGAIFASEDVRNAVIGEEIITQSGIDNSQLLAADLENFDTNLKINNVLEDEENYYVDYAFNTIAVRDNIWQLVVKSEKFTVNKTALGNRDLGIYLAEEFSELARSEMAYLKEAQKNERERGKTQIVETTDYTGLIGLTLDLKNKILAGYEPVVKPPVAEIVQGPICQPTTEVCDGLDNNCDGQIDEGGVCEATAPLPAPADVCDATHLDLCQNEADCQTASGYWYNNVCNAEPLDAAQGEPEAPACVPDWSCTDWQPLSETVACGQAFPQNRTCTDLNNCSPAQISEGNLGGQADESPKESFQLPTGQGKPVETQEVTGTLCSAQNATGTCQSGTCSFTCAEGFSNCDNDWTNGCESTSTSTTVEIIATEPTTTTATTTEVQATTTEQTTTPATTESTSTEATTTQATTTEQTATPATTESTSTEATTTQATTTEQTATSTEAATTTKQAQ